MADVKVIKNKACEGFCGWRESYKRIGYVKDLALNEKVICASEFFFRVKNSNRNLNEEISIHYNC